MFETEKEATISYEVIGHSENNSFTYKTSTPTEETSTDSNGALC